MASVPTMAIRRRLKSFALLAACAACWPLPGYAAANYEETDSPGKKPAEPADLIFRSGLVYTLNDRQPTAQAVAVAHGKIVFVGGHGQSVAYEGLKTRVVDLHGNVLLPGIIDSHIHPALGEYFNRRLCNVQSFTLEEGYEKLAHCAKIAPKGDWVVAFGWYFTDNPQLSDVTLKRLDAIVPDRRLAVIARDFHTVWVNSRTLSDFSITRDTPDPAGGSYARDPATHQPTGVLRDAAALGLINGVEHDSPYAVPTLELYRTVLPYLNSLGMTSMLDALADDDAEAAYRKLEAEGALTMRVSLAFRASAENYRTEIARIGAKRAKNDSYIRVDYVKIFADGNAEDKLANLLTADGKSGPATHGYFTQAQMNEVVRLAEQNGLSIYVHSIGDGAARQVLDAVAAARKDSPCFQCRHTLTHLQWIWPTDIPRLKQLHVIANVQEGWLAPRSIGGPAGYDYVKDTAAGPLGPTLAKRMYPFRQLGEAGARLSAGSDWFFTDENPWNDIEAGATSRDPGVADSVAMLPDHTIDVKTLLKARTIDAAYQMFDEKEIGSIEVGKDADLVVVNQNILDIPVDQIHRTKVLMTFFAGREVVSGH
jgi:predicted amidohydrolase YtcJ